MGEIKVYFVHPTEGRQVSVKMDDSMNCREVIGELLSANFIRDHVDGYELALKAGPTLRYGCSFRQAGVKGEDIIRIIPRTDAG